MKQRQTVYQALTEANSRAQQYVRDTIEAPRSSGHKGGPCNHRRSPAGDCQMLTAEAIEPDATDLEYGKQLVQEGWLSVSTRYRQVARLKQPWPGPKMLTPEWRDHPYGQWVIDRLERFEPGVLRSFASGKPSDLVEMRELTIRQWRAFKMAGGQSA